MRIFAAKSEVMDKPFIFGIPVEDTHFIGREKEIQRLSTNFKYGVNTILLSPRRWGKTSLVNKVAGLVASKDLVVVKMDIFSCRNEYDFYNTFSAAILKQTASRIEEWKDTLIYHENSLLDDLNENFQNIAVECILMEQIRRYGKPDDYLTQWYKYLEGEVM